MTERLINQEYADHFRDEEIIGRGHFAVVRRCVEVSSGNEYACKLVRKRRIAGSKRGLPPEDIQREVDVLRTTDHPNIVRLHRYFDCGPQFAILVLELISGGELFQLVSDRGFLDEPEAAQLVQHLLHAVDHLHQNMIVHLDLKPENILLHETQGLKLIDFGLSRWLEPGVEIREIMGTPEFVAPEIVNFEPISTATDMWSLGVIAFNLLTGLSPFLGDNKQQTFSNVSCGLFHSEALEDLSPEANDFIQDLLQKEPRKRPSAKMCLQYPWILQHCPCVQPVPPPMCQSIAEPDFETDAVDTSTVQQISDPDYDETDATRVQSQRECDIPQRDENFVVAAFFSSLEEGNLAGLEEIFLMSQHLDPNQANKHGETAVHMAAGLGHLDILKFLHSKKADLGRLDGHGDSAVYWAARQGQTEVIQFLHDNQVPLDSNNKAGESALHVAARYGHTPAVQMLCALGANINAIDEHGETALHIAVWHGFPKIVHALCQDGAMTNVRNKEQETPLHCAAARGHSESVRCLLEARADPDLLDKHGCTSLHLSLRRHHISAAMLLLHSGCKVDVIDSHGEAPIHIACREGLLPLVQTLCAYGCTVDIPNKVGLYPLHLAAKNGHRDVARCLCLAGCNVEQKNRDGLTAEIMSLAQGYNSIADLLSRVKSEAIRDDYIAQLIPSNQPISRIKLKVFGHSGSGKTTLLDSLQAGYFSSWFRSLGKASSPNTSMVHSNGSLASRSSNDLDTSGVSEGGLSFETLNSNYTRGIDIRQVNLSAVGDMSIWEFSGHEPYHLVYEHFVGNTSCLHAVLFRLTDPLDIQIQQVHYWLRFLQARIPPTDPLGVCGKSKSPARVCLVATHADLASTHNNNNNSIGSKEEHASDHLVDMAQIVLASARECFKHIFDLHDQVFIVDAHLASSAPIKGFKQYLATTRAQILKSLPPHTTFLEGVLAGLVQWRRLSSTFPVVAWPQFMEQVQGQVNGLAGQEHLREVLQQLQLMGEVLYLKAPAPTVPVGGVAEGSGQDLVVLSPRWLTCDVVGYLLSKEHVQQARLTGCYTVDDMQLLFPDTDALDLLQVLECLHLCTQCHSDGEIEYEFPCFNLVESSLESLWEKNDVRFLQGTYAGVRLQCPPGVHHMLACLFPRLQVQLRRCAQEQSTEAGANDLYQWHQGSKFCTGPVESLLTLRDAGEAIEIKVRAPPDMMTECFCLLEDLLGVTEQVLLDACPGLLIEKHLLSSLQLRQHLDYVTGYSNERLFKALLGSNSPSREGISEEVPDYDVSTCREAGVLATAPDLHVSHLSLLSKQHLCALLDPNDPMGRDWCMLGVLLGLAEKLPKVDPEQQKEQVSPTARLLEEWSKSSDSTVGHLLRALEELGRHDASQVIFRTAPLLKVLPVDHHGLFVEEEEEEASSQDTGIHVGSNTSNLSR